MAWPSLKTWTSVVVTVLDLNTEIRDRMATLKTSIADNGDIAAPNAISGVAQGNLLGTSSGNAASPTRSNTNLKLYDNSASNWAGVGTDTAGKMYFVTGTSGTPSTRFSIDPAGTVVVPSPGVFEALGASLLADTIPLLRGYQEKFQIVASAGTTVIDIANGNHVILTLGTNVSAFTITSSVFGFTSGYVQPVVFHIQHDGTLRTITWTINGIAVRFSSAVAPTLASANGFITRVVVYLMSGYAFFGEQIGYNG